MVGSTSGLLGNVGQANYGAAKLGIAGLSRIVAMENTSKNVTSNVICPSADTRMTRSVPTPKDADAAAEREERLRLSPADAIAPLCTFLASEDAGHVTGQIFHQRGAELSLYSQPRPIRTIHKNQGWTVETIRDKAMPSLAPHFIDIANSRNVHPGLPLE